MVATNASSSRLNVLKTKKIVKYKRFYATLLFECRELVTDYFTMIMPKEWLLLNILDLLLTFSI